MVSLNLVSDPIFQILSMQKKLKIEKENEKACECSDEVYESFKYFKWCSRLNENKHLSSLIPSNLTCIAEASWKSRETGKSQRRKFGNKRIKTSWNANQSFEFNLQFLSFSINFICYLFHFFKKQAFGSTSSSTFSVYLGFNVQLNYSRNANNCIQFVIKKPQRNNFKCTLKIQKILKLSRLQYLKKNSWPKQ